MVHSDRSPLPEVLATRGIAVLADPIDGATVADWNARLDPLFAGSGGRSYVGADGLADSGILASLVDGPVGAVIAATVPDARLYHCHAYEIDGRATRPHIHAGHLDGWHRDTETIRGFDPARARHLSVFVYLSDVGPDSGAFEFLPAPPPVRGAATLPAHRLEGGPGTTFVWNRSYYHRASPNRSATRRRLLKLSWQPAGLPNDRLAADEFARVAATTGRSDPTLAVLLGTRGVHVRLPATATPATVPPPLNSTLSVRRTERLLESARVLRHRIGR